MIPNFVTEITVGETLDDIQTISLTCAGDVKPQSINWLWPDRIALGKLTMIAGDPGLGKSLLIQMPNARDNLGLLYIFLFSFAWAGPINKKKMTIVAVKVHRIYLTHL